VELTLNGERVRITTRAGDQLNAERGIGQSPLNSPVELGMRVWWSALRRQYPDHPAAKTFREFVDELDGGDELDEMDEDPPGLDPTRLVDTDD
jgi:hypothetical protein